MEPEKARDLVQKLRAKAASTTFPEEAKLLTQKADKLARKYHVRAEPPPRRHRRVWRPVPPPPQPTYAGVRWNTMPAQRDAFCDENGNLHYG